MIHRLDPRSLPMEQLGDHTLIATYTTTYGDDPTYEAMIITVECTVTGFTKPANPADVTYTVWDGQETFRIDQLIYE